MEQGIILVATLTLIILVVIMIIFFSIFQSKKNQYILDKQQSKRIFEEEIVKSQMEIKEQALKNFGWELHDNVGQLLSIARMQVNILKQELPGPQSDKLDEVDELIGLSLNEIRLLSKALNPEIIHNLGLVESVKLELERFNKLKFLHAELTVKGGVPEIEQKDEIIIFRILQEFFSNVLKHSKAHSLKVLFDYQSENLVIRAEDDGVGFEPENISEGSGLINMKSRAHMIGATYTLKSGREQGASLVLEYYITRK